MVEERQAGSSALPHAVQASSMSSVPPTHAGADCVQGGWSSSPHSVHTGDTAAVRLPVASRLKPMVNSSPSSQPAKHVPRNGTRGSKGLQGGRGAPAKVPAHVGSSGCPQRVHTSYSSTAPTFTGIVSEQCHDASYRIEEQANLLCSSTTSEVGSKLCVQDEAVQATGGHAGPHLEHGELATPALLPLSAGLLACCATCSALAV